MEVHIGIDENKREKIADGLSKVLADSYMLYLKRHNYHWNVTGNLLDLKIKRRELLILSNSLYISRESKP